MIQLIGLGAGGHAKVVIDILRLIGGYEFVGLLDRRKELWGTEVLGIPVLGNDALLHKLYEQDVRHAFIGVGAVGNTRPRRLLYDKACRQGFLIVSAVHPQAIISPSSKFGTGATIMAGVIINSSTCLGNNVIVNTGAIVEHDCHIGNHVHIATGARLAGTVHVSDGAHIGLGASIRECVHIGRNVIVGAGAVVVSDVPDNATVAGVPARIIRKSGE